MALPPLKSKTAAVENEFSSLANQVTNDANSSTFANLFLGIFDQMTEEHINYMLSKIPRNKFAKVEELASLVTWLASEENSFSTAAVFDLSGGRATY